MTQSLQKSIAHRKPLYGVGVNDADYITNPTVGGKKAMCKYYRTWRSMMERCYSIKCHAKHPTYIGCTVAPEWHSFMTFREWMIAQDWRGRSLDKDLIKLGNKIYSPETCLFVSRQINSLLTTSKATRGDLPLGVTRNGKRFLATVRINNKPQHIGRFATPEEAAAAYNAAKATHIRHIAAEQSDSRISTALLRHAERYERGEMQ